MKIIIEKYQKKDFAGLEKCVEHLQDHVVVLDSLKLIHKPANYAKKAIYYLLKAKESRILLAKYKGEVVGYVAGEIEKQTVEDNLEWKPKKIGNVLELFVFKEYRRFGIGKKLMQKIDNYFKSKGCDFSRIWVLEQNKESRPFYYKLGFHNRMTSMLKKL